jgi:hypothetical protein
LGFDAVVRLISARDQRIRELRVMSCPVKSSGAEWSGVLGKLVLGVEGE